jgi:hypothetical protein
MVNTSAQGHIETIKDYDNDPAGQYRRWAAELEASHKAQREWLNIGNKVVKAYKNDKQAGAEDTFRLNFFYSNITTLKSMLFGKTPEVSFDRANFDYDDDVARVAAMMMTRICQSDIGTPGDEYSDALHMNLQDRLLPGLGLSRVRYEYESEEIEVATQFDLDGNVIQAGYTDTRLLWEKAPLEYVHWRDFRWSPCRYWSEVRWIAFKTYMTRDRLIKRFGEEIGKKVPLTQTPESKQDDEGNDSNDPHRDAWARAEIWEIWCKENKTVYWFCPGFDRILDTKEDPLKLTGFFPIPRPMAANITSDAYMPVPDYKMAEDLYNEINQLETRIAMITRAVKVVGVYDKSQPDIERLFVEAVENDLIAVDNWVMWAEKGGIQGVIEWLPIKDIAAVLQQLIARRNDAKAQLWEIAGMSDIMRGGGGGAGGPVSATERSLEARFSSVRVQALQDEFSNYATDLIRLRAEVISKHFSPETIIKQSNIMRTIDGKDPQRVQDAVGLIKNQLDFVWRIQVKPESVAMVDYAQLKQERTEYITALATYMQSSSTMIKERPEMGPLLLEMLKWGLAGFKGSQDVEALVDHAIEQANQQQKQGNEQEKNNPEMFKMQNDREARQHEVQLEQMRFKNEAQLYMIKAEADRGEVSHETMQRIQEVKAETEQDIIKERAQMEANMAEETHETMEFIRREQARARMQDQTRSRETQ